MSEDKTWIQRNGALLSVAVALFLALAGSIGALYTRVRTLETDAAVLKVQIEQNTRSIERQWSRLQRSQTDK